MQSLFKYLGIQSLDSDIKSINPNFYQDGRSHIKERSSDRFPRLHIVSQKNIEKIYNPNDLIFCLNDHNLNFDFARWEEKENIFNFIPSQDFSELRAFYEYLIGPVAMSEEKKLVELGMKNTRKVLKSLTSEIKLDKDVENELLQITTLDQLKSVLEINCNVKVLTGLELLFSSDDPSVYYLGLLNENLFLEAQESALTAQLINFTSHAIERLRPLVKVEQRLTELEQNLSKIKLPLAVFDGQSHLLLHNPLFIDLGLSTTKCLKLLNHDRVKIQNQFYEVQIEREENGMSLFFFVPIETTRQGLPSSRELGIITSSIAHELNNPLAGTMAAIELMMLDVDSEELKEQLLEMKGGLKRCQALVDTFLGFSRYKVEANTKGTVNLANCLEQAQQLMRFRLIENNLSLDLSLVQTGQFGLQFNSSILTMCFYLLLNDIVTEFLHHSLVMGREGIKSIEVQVDVLDDRFSFETQNKLELSKYFKTNKLLSHLIGLLKLDVQVDDGHITFHALL